MSTQTCPTLSVFALQADAESGAELARAQAALSQRKGLRPSLSRSPTINRSVSSTEKPGAAMVKFPARA